MGSARIRAARLLSRVLAGLAEDSEEMELQQLAGSLRVGPADMRLCLQEALSRRLWQSFDDSIGLSPGSDYALLENLCAVVLGVGSRLAELLCVYDVLLQNCLVTDTLVSFMEANYLGLLPHLVEHLSRERYMHVRIRSLHSDLCTIFSRESVYLFENMLLRQARALAHQMFLRSRDGDGRNQDYAEFMELLRVDSLCGIHLWAAIKLEIAREFMRLDGAAFQNNCPLLFEAGPGAIAFLRSAMAPRAFLDALVRFLKRAHAGKRMHTLVSTYAQFHALLSDAPEAKALRFVQSPRFLNRLLGTHMLAGTLPEEMLSGVRAVLACMDADARAGFLRLYRAQMIKRVLTGAACAREEMRVVSHFAHMDRCGYLNAMDFLGRSMGSGLRTQRVECLLVCRYTLPEPIPAAALEPVPDLFPALHCALDSMREQNPEMDFAVSLHFGYAEFELDMRSGPLLVTGHTVHYVLATALARARASYADLLALADGDQRLLDAALCRMRERGLVRVCEHHIELCEDVKCEGVLALATPEPEPQK
ncbi:MC027 [Molluscum contagiosum virus subtype 1]|nr:MC027 [Molluscum contagiosum virus subtype 1]DBA42654.1 TPA_asm: MC027L [Molluscum contagiosum virus]